jgi:hypothetical protein
MADVQKGKISTIEGPVDRNGNSTRARVIPEQADGVVTKPLVIASQLRGKAGNLTKGTEVVFAVFPDQAGIILSRADGELYGTICGDVTVTGNLTANDVKTDTLSSVNNHVHGGVESGSSNTSKAKN